MMGDTKLKDGEYCLTVSVRFNDGMTVNEVTHSGTDGWAGEVAADTFLTRMHEACWKVAKEIAERDHDDCTGGPTG